MLTDEKITEFLKNARERLAELDAEYERLREKIPHTEASAETEAEARRLLEEQIRLDKEGEAERRGAIKRELFGESSAAGRGVRGIRRRGMAV